MKNSQKIKNSNLHKRQQYFRVKTKTKVTVRNTGICYSTKRVWLAHDYKFIKQVAIANNIS